MTFDDGDIVGHDLSEVQKTGKIGVKSGAAHFNVKGISMFMLIVGLVWSGILELQTLPIFV